MELPPPIQPLLTPDNQPVPFPWNMLDAAVTPRTFVPLSDVHMFNPFHEPYPAWRLNRSLGSAVHKARDSQEQLVREFGRLGSPECPRFPKIPGIAKMIENGDMTPLREIILAARLNPRSAENMQRLACLLQSLSLRNLIGPENSQIKPIANGRDAVVAPGVLAPRFAGAVDPTDPPPFIIKTALGDDTETFNEMLVGIYGLNALRASIPNFMFIYGAYQCTAAEIETDPNNAQRVIATRLCPTGGGRKGYYEMVETLPNAQTLYQFINYTINAADDPTVFSETLDALIAQVLLALAMAQEHCDFAHQDLHANNVLVQDFGHEVSQVYPFKDGSVYWVKTRYICTIIDYGRSFCRIELPPIPADHAAEFDPNILALSPDGTATIIHAGFVDPPRGLSFCSANHLYDVCRFVGSVATCVVHSSLARHVFQWLEPLFESKESYEAIRAYRHLWQNECFNVSPLNITINKRDVVDARLGDRASVVVRSVDRPAHWAGW